MAYTPPPHDQVNLDLNSTQQPLSHNAVDFELEPMVHQCNTYVPPPSNAGDMDFANLYTPPQSNAADMDYCVVDEWSCITYVPVPGNAADLKLEGAYSPKPGNSADLDFCVYGVTESRPAGPSEGNDFVAITKTYRISGTVTNSLGNPWAGLQIALTGDSGNYVSTNAVGYYEFEVPAGNYVVTPDDPDGVFTPAGISATVNEVVGESLSNDFDGIWYHYHITGTLTDDEGNLLDGAQISVTGDITTSVQSISGQYDLSGLAPGTYTVTPSYLEAGFAPSTATLAISDTDAVQDFAFRRHFAVHGFLKDALGNPAVGIEITATPQIGDFPGAAVSDAGGFYEFDLDDGVYDVVPDQLDWTFHPAQVTIDVSGDYTIPDILSTHEIFTITGTVTDASGDPIPNVAVSLDGDQTDTTTTDIDGAYVFDFLASGNYSVTVAANEYAFATDTAAVTVNEASVDQVNFTGVITTYTISGTLLDDVGVPVSGAQIHLSGDYTASTASATNGTFSFEVTHGTYEVWPSKDEYLFTPEAQIVSVDYTTGDVTVAFTVDLMKYTLSGNVIDEVGFPAKQIHILLDGTSPFRATNQLPSEDLTDLTGEWAFEVPVGTYTVRIDPEEIAPSDGSFPRYEFLPPQTLSVELSGGYESTDNIFHAKKYHVLSGQATYLPAGAAFPGVLVDLSGEYTLQTEADGTFAFNVFSGDYVLTPSFPEYTFAPEGYQVQVPHDAGDVPDLNFEGTLSTYTVSGYLVQSDPTDPVLGIDLHVTGEESDPIQGSVVDQHLLTNVSGEYSLDLARGAYTLEPSYPEYVFTPANYTIADLQMSGAYPFQIARHTYTISGTARDEAGRPFENLPLLISGDYETALMTNLSGDYILSGLKNGSYQIIAQPDPADDRIYQNEIDPLTQTVTVNETAGDQVADLTIQRQYPVYGTVLDDDATPFPGFSLTVAGRGGPYTIVTNTDGAWMKRLPNDSYAVSYGAPNTVFAPHSGSTLVVQSESGRYDMTGYGLRTITGHIQATEVGHGPYPVPMVALELSGDLPNSDVADVYNRQQTLTDASGDYLFDVVDANYRVTASLEEYTFTPLHHNVIVEDASVPQRDFMGERQTYTASGQLADSEGQPIPDATITVEVLARDSLGTLPETYTATTDPSGEFLIDHLISGSYRLTPTKGFWFFTPESVEFDLPATSGDYVLDGVTGTHIRIISGLVSDTQGAPISGAYVGTADQQSGAYEQLSFRTGSDGTYSLLVQHYQDYQVQISHPDYDFTVNEHSYPHLDTDILDAPFTGDVHRNTIHGQVVDGHGLPLTEPIVVDVSGEMVNLATPESLPDPMTTGPSGDFTLTLPNGEYALNLSRSRYTFTPDIPYPLSLHRTDIEDTFTARAHNLVSGSLYDTEYLLGPSNLPIHVSGDYAVETVTDQSGNYLLDLDNGTYILWPDSGDYTGWNPPQYTFTVHEEDLTLGESQGQPRHWHQRIVVREENTLDPVSGLDVTVIPDSGNYPYDEPLAGMTDSSGVYDVAVPFGHYTIGVTDPNGVWSIAPSPIEADVTGGDDLYELSAAKPWQVSGAVEDTQGHPLAGRPVVLFGTRNDLGQSYTVSMDTVTDASGGYSFDVPSGNFTVSVHTLGYYDTIDATADITVASGAVSVPTFTLPLHLYTIDVVWTTGQSVMPDLTGTLTRLNDPYCPTDYIVAANPQTAPNGMLTWTLPKGHYSGDYTTLNDAVTLAPRLLAPDDFVSDHFKASYSVDLDLMVSGRVAFDASTPVTAIPVQLRSGGLLLETTTDLSGDYSFTGINQGAYTVTPILPSPGDLLETQSDGTRVYALHYDAYAVPGSRDLTLDWNSQTADFTAMPRTYQVQGRLTDIYGEPVSGVTVTTGADQTVSDELGRYTLAGLPSGTYDVLFQHATMTFEPAGYTDQDITVNALLRTNGTYTFTEGSLLGRDAVGTGTLEISGEIVPDDATARDIHTVALTGETAHTVLTDESGQYAFQVAAGQYQVTPDHPEFTYVPESGNLTLTDSDAILGFQAHRTLYTFSGWLVNERNEPIVNWNVTITGTDSLTGAPVAFTAVTDADGYYEFQVPSGSYRATPEQETVDYLYTWSPEYRVFSVSASNTTALNYSLNFAGDVSYRLHGFVRTETNLPMKDVTVNLTGAVTRSIKTDGAGYYSFIVTSPGTYTLEPVDNDPASYFATVEPFYTETSVTKNFKRHYYGTINGTVFSDTDASGVYDGTQDTLADIAVRLRDALDGTLIQEITTDPDGHYLFEDVEIGVYTVTEINHPWYASTTPDTVQQTIADHDEVEVNFGDTPKPGDIAGSVFNDHNVNQLRDPGEYGYAGHHVSLWQFRNETLLPVADTVTNADGRYTFTDLHGLESYVIIADNLAGANSTRPLQQTITITPDATEQVDFGFYFALFVTGTVKTADGTPITEATVTLTGANLLTTDEGNATQLTLPVDTSGYFAAYTVSGDYTLAVGLDEYDFVPDSEQFTLDINGKYAYFIGTERIYAVTGTVYDQGGQPVENAEILVDGEVQTTTGATGRYQIDLPLGTYTFTCHYLNNRVSPATRSVTVIGNAIGSQNFYLTYLLTLAGRLADTQGNAVSEPIQIEGTEYHTVTADSNGYYSVALPAGTYTIIPDPSDYTWLPENRTVTLSDASIGKQNFVGVQSTGKFDPTPAIEGRVWEHGVRISRVVRVYSRQTFALVGEVVSSGDGYWSLELPEDYESRWGDTFFVVVLDAQDVEPLLNAQIRDRIIVTQLT